MPALSHRKLSRLETSQPIRTLAAKPTAMPSKLTPPRHPLAPLRTPTLPSFGCIASEALDFSRITPLYLQKHRVFAST